MNKKLILVVILVVILAVVLCSCDADNLNIDRTPIEGIEYSGNFKIISKRTTCNCVTIEFYDVGTKVMYLFVKMSQGAGLTMLVNADGTPKLYEEEN